MDRVVWLDILRDVGLFFVHPLFYLGIIIMVAIGLRRVRRERKDFNIKVYDFVEELVSSIKPGFILGIILSLIIVGSGIVLSPTALIIIAGAYIILTFTFQIRWLSAAYVLPLTFILLFFLTDHSFQIPIFGEITFTSDEQLLFHLSLLFALVLIAEGVLIKYFAWKNTSPRLFLSSRGKYVGGHEAKRLWAVPIFVLVPNGMIPSFMEWPFFSFGAQDTYSLVLVPFFVGFQQLVKSTIPQSAIKQLGSRVLLLGIGALLIAIAGYFYSLLFIIGAFIILLIREVLSVIQKLRDDSKIGIFRLQEHGVIILGILPQSSAEKIGLKIGEIILNVNGEEVNRPSQFYEALQKKAASVKMEVLDHNGEVRLVQTALYDGEHHELGILLVKEDYTYQDSIV